MILDRKSWKKFIEERNPLFVSSFKSINHGLQHYTKRNIPDERRFCVNEVDHGIELFFKGILLRNGQYPYYTRFQTLLSKVKTYLNMTESDETMIKDLHKERDRCYHQGRVPRIERTEFLVNSTLNLLLNKAEKFLGITPENMRKQIPNILGMDREHIDVSKLPEKPDILESLENASVSLFAVGDKDTAFSQIVIVLHKFIDFLYKHENGPYYWFMSRESIRPLPTKEFNPEVIFRNEIRALSPTLEAELGEAIQEANVRFSRIPFKETIPVMLIPITVIAIYELSYLRDLQAIDSKICDRIRKLLRLDLLRLLREQERFPLRIENKLKEYFDCISEACEIAGKKLISVGYKMMGDINELPGIIQRVESLRLCRNFHKHASACFPQLQ